MQQRPNASQTALLRLFQFEKEIRLAAKREDLEYLIVNQLRSLVPEVVRAAK